MALRFFGKLKAFKVKAMALKYIKIIKISKKDTNNFGCSSKAPRRLGSLSLRPWIRTSCSMEHLRSFGLSVANILLVYDTFMIPQYSCFDDNFRIFPPLFPKGQGLSSWTEGLAHQARFFQPLKRALAQPLGNDMDLDATANLMVQAHFKRNSAKLIRNQNLGSSCSLVYYCVVQSHERSGCCTTPAHTVQLEKWLCERATVS